VRTSSELELLQLVTTSDVSNAKKTLA
jgi:hypothetical protein